MQKERPSSPAQAVADELKAQGARVHPVTVDVSQHASVVAMADEAWTSFGQVDILCNNAGVSWRPFRTLLEASMEDWKFIMNVNLWGVIHGLDVFLPRMRAQKGEKHIVNTASLGGILPLAGHTPYSASKAAVTFISEGLAPLTSGAVRRPLDPHFSRSPHECHYSQA